MLERSVQATERVTAGYLQPRRAHGNLIVQPYAGWGTPQGVELRGRVLLPRTMRPAKRGDPRWRNFKNVMRRLFSREVGNITVTGTLCGCTAQAVSDSDGFFSLMFAPTQGTFPEGWNMAQLQIEGREGVTEAQALVIEHARYGIISDLDDTVIQSDVTSVPRMVMTTFTGNARTRLPFPGVGALYRAMTKDGAARNPIFYVSSSPWNFFDLLWQFLHHRRIPLGPLFLRNWGFDLLKGHGEYKQGVIGTILNKYPNLPFVLVGDSGEHDPEIYAQVVKDFPGRILAVYIRDVTTSPRRETILKIREEVGKSSVHMVLARDSLAAAMHAMSLGLITPQELRGVMNSVAKEYET